MPLHPEVKGDFPRVPSHLIGVHLLTCLHKRYGHKISLQRHAGLILRASIYYGGQHISVLQVPMLLLSELLVHMLRMTIRAS